MKGNWNRHRLDECTRIVGGATPASGEESYWNGDVYWATPRDLSDLEGSYISETPRKLTRAGLESCSSEILPPGSVLFSSRAPIGHVAINTVPMATNQGFKSFIPDQKLVFAPFLFWWLRTNKAYLESLGNGATFKEVSKAVVSRIEIDLPPLPEQHRIADILDRADALRAKRLAALARLDELTQAIFIEMFGSEVNSAWPERKLDDVAEIITGFAFKSDEYVEVGESINLCRGANVLPGRLDWSDLAKWPTAKAKGLEPFNLNVGDVVIAMDRPWISDGFKLAVVTAEDCPAFLVQRVARMRANSKYALNSFIYGLLGRPEFTRHCKPTETTVPHISPLEIRDFTFRLPPLALQKDFNARIDQVGKLKMKCRTALADNETLFASLQDRAFRGAL